MHTGQIVFAQLMKLLPLHQFRKCVNVITAITKYGEFSCLDQFLCLAFAQLTYRESLRDIEILSAGETLLFVSYGHQRQCFAEYLGRCQRNQRLAYLCRFRPGADWHSPTSLCDRRLRGATERDRLRFRFHHHRSVSETFSLGPIPENQGHRQTTYPVESSRSHFRSYLYHRRSSARRQHLGCVLFSTRRHLPVGPGVFGFQTSLHYPSIRSLFCHAGQKKYARSTSLFPTRRQVHRLSFGPDHFSYRLPYRPGLPRATPAHFLSRPRHQQISGFPDQQFPPAGANHRPTLQDPLAGGNILQVDQTTPPYQGLLWHLRQRRQNSALDCGVRICPGGHSEEKTQYSSYPLHYFTDFKRPPIRQRTALRLAFTTISRFAKQRYLGGTVAIIHLTFGHL